MRGVSIYARCRYPATEMLPHVGIRVSASCQEGLSATPLGSPRASRRSGSFCLKPLRLYPSHGAAVRQPCGPMGRNCNHDPDVPAPAGLDPGLLPRRTVHACAEPGRFHLPEALRSMKMACPFGGAGFGSGFFVAELPEYLSAQPDWYITDLITHLRLLQRFWYFIA